ncbi:MAG: FtsX-like permease family protein, partial [Planctomycetota bacterium]|nr:FtsX-like permease family protein [Planctomycetota bacterium]
FRNGVKVLGCLALILGMFVVFQTLSQSLVERLRQIGLLRCLGASRGTIARVFLFDALATALIGSVLGIGLGILLAMCLQAWDVSTLGMGREVTVFELPLATIAWTAFLGVVFTTAGAGFPLWKARNLPAIEILNPRGLSEDGAGRHVLRGINLFLFVMLVLILPGAYLAMTPLVSEEGGETLVVLAQLGGMVLLFGGLLLVSPHVIRFLGGLVLIPLRRLLRLPAFLVGKAMRQNSGRFAASVCGLAIVLMALVGLKSITAALADEQRQFGETAMKDRLFIKCAPLTPAQLQPLREIAGIKKVDAFEGRVGVTFEMRGLDRRELSPYDSEDSRPVEERSLRRRVIVSKRLARLRGFEDGGVVNVMTDEGSRAYEIVRIADSIGFFPDERAWAITHPSCLVQDFCVPQANIDRVSIAHDPSIDRRRILADIRKLIPSATWAKFGTEIVEYHIRDIARDFLLFDILLWLILSLAAVGLINGMTIAAVARAREIGVLRALGMSDGSLRASFLLEGALVAILAAGLALALSLPLGYLVVTGLNRVAGLEASYVPPIAWVGWVPLIAIAVGLIAAILPGLRAVRENPAAAVRYE